MTPEQYVASFNRFAEQGASRPRFVLDWNRRHPVLDEDTPQTSLDRHYFYHTAWASRVLRKTAPALHHDFSSLLYFLAAASAWVPITFCDIRPAAIQLDNVTVRREDLMALSFADASIESLSCMHVVEHVGLGRYGDEVDYDGDLKAVAELKRVAAPGGNILFVVPVGHEPTVIFNAHRVYSWDGVLAMFDGCTAVETALISGRADRGGLIHSPSPADLADETYGCGCFWFRKR
ncbi:DUF268 domain-containing protein [Azospirillum sp. sgz301742]